MQAGDHTSSTRRDSFGIPAPPVSANGPVASADSLHAAFGQPEGAGTTARSAPVQRAAVDDSRLSEETIQRAARLGTQGASQALPFLSTIQRSFGKHDVSNIKAHLGEEARAGAAQMHAHAFAQGENIAFGEQPSLRMAAHEAAHVVQQRSGLTLPSGVGQCGDAHEQHADAVADAVASGKSSESLLSRYTPSGSAQAPAQPVQMWSLRRRPATGWGSKSIAKWSPMAGTKVKLKRGDPATEGDSQWMMELLVRNSLGVYRSKGKMELNYFSQANTFQPDNLRVARDDRRNNYGGLLGQEVLTAAQNPEVQSVLNANSRIHLNLVNPLSAYISVKQLNSTFNNGVDTQDAAANTAAQQAVTAHGTQTAGFRLAQFPSLWSRIADLSLRHQVVFTMAGKNRFSATYDRNTDFTDFNTALGCLRHFASGSIDGGKAFVVNIDCPVPALPQPQDDDP